MFTSCQRACRGKGKEEGFVGNVSHVSGTISGIGQGFLDFEVKKYYSLAAFFLIYKRTRYRTLGKCEGVQVSRRRYRSPGNSAGVQVKL